MLKFLCFKENFISIPNRFFCVLMEVVRHPGVEQSPLVVKKGLVSSRIKKAIRVKKCTLSIKKHKGQKRDIAYLCNIR